MDTVCPDFVNDANNILSNKYMWPIISRFTVYKMDLFCIIWKICNVLFKFC